MLLRNWASEVASRYFLFAAFFLFILGGLLSPQSAYSAVVSDISIAGSIVGGSTQTITGTVSITRQPTNDNSAVGVSLSCSSPCYVSIPGSVTVAAGASSATFSITSSSVVGSPQTSTVTATLGGTASTQVTTTPLVGSLSISPGTIVGGSTQAVTGTITLNAPSSANRSVSLSCSSPCYVSIPGTVGVSIGASSGTFTFMSTSIVGSPQTSTVTATLGFATSADVITTPLLQSISISPGTIVGGSTQAVTGTITLNAPSFANRSISLSCSSPCYVSIPGTASVSSGASSKTFTITSSSIVGLPQTSTVTATLGKSVSASVNTDPFKPTLTLSPTALASGQSGTGSVSLNAVPSSGKTVSLSVNPAGIISVPASVVINSGTSTSSPFTFTTATESTLTAAIVTATLNGNSDSKAVAVDVENSDACSGCSKTPVADIDHAGHPINLTNGNTWISQTDYSIPGLGGGFTLQRTWSSLWQGLGSSLGVTGMFGHGWRSTLEERLQIVSPTSLKYWRSDGSQWSYVSTAMGWQQIAPMNDSATLQFDSSTTLFTLSFSNGTKEIFSNPGYLTQIVDRNNLQTTITYDSYGRVQNVTDPAGRTLTFNYVDETSAQVLSVQDSVGTVATYSYSGTLLSNVTYADGSALNYNYDANNLILSVTNGGGAVLEAHTYDSSRRGLTSERANGAERVAVNYSSQGTTVITDSKSNTTTIQYATISGRKFVTSFTGAGCVTCGASSSLTRTHDAAGNVLTETDALGHTTTFTYDNSNNVLRKTIQVGSSTYATWSYTYNAFGQVLTVTDPLGNVTTNTYDARGNLVTVANPAPDSSTAPSVTQFAYDSLGQLTQITDPLGRATTLTYNSVGLLESVTDAQNNATTYQYDARGNRTSMVDPADHQTTYAYDLGNRLTGVTYPDLTTASFTYDSRGRRISAIDQNGKTTAYAYDDVDRLTTVTDSANKSTQYAYDTESNLVGITDANGNTTAFSYDASRRVIQTAFPSTLTESYLYDAVGNLTSKTDRKQQTISYSYDAADRMVLKTYPGSTTVQYAYDLAGKLLNVVDSTDSYGFSYDKMARLIGTTTAYSFLPGQTFSNTYGYDANSNRTSYTSPDGSTNSYTYDTLNRLTGLTNSWAGAFNLGYDELSRRTSLGRPNSVNTTYQYDSLSRLLSVLHSGANDGANYTYDAAGNRLSKQNLLTGVTENYTYDLIYQLTQVMQGTNTTESYSYDPVGNRLSSPGLSPWNINSSNQLTGTPEANFTYDANGNMLSKAAAAGTTDYTWDLENRLASVNLPANGGTVSFAYDPFGHRIQKTTAFGSTIYLYDGANIVVELNASGAVVASYTQGSGIDEPLATRRGGNIAYYHADGLGSVTSLTGSTGQTVSTYTYDSFGNTTPTEGIFNPYRYTAREQDQETGLYYYRARYYDPSIGRFISEDPIGFKGGKNFYTYVRNNPARFSDPFGLQSYAQQYAATGAAAGTITVAIGSLAVDAATGGVNILATPEELAGGATLGSWIGYGIGRVVDACHRSKSISNPITGAPGSVSTIPQRDGSPKQVRRYGPDGYPETDVDYDHDHGQGKPHAHDWGRPAGGGKPTKEDRGTGRSPVPNDPTPK